MLKHPLGADLDTHRDDIAPIIAREIIERYYLEPGRIAKQLQSDPGLDSAITVLSTENRAQSILRP